MKLVAEVSSLTHRHPRSIAACGIYICAALEIMRTGCLKEGIQKGVQKAFDFYERDPKYSCQLEHFSEIRNPEKLEKRPAVEIIGKGYVVDTLKTALWSLMRGESFKDVILSCINCGYDTDTTAAVAGDWQDLYIRCRRTGCRQCRTGNWFQRYAGIWKELCSEAKEKKEGNGSGRFCICICSAGICCFLLEGVKQLRETEYTCHTDFPVSGLQVQ